MARVQTIQTNFTAGELSPRLLGRVEVSRYNNGAKTMLNMYPLVHGGTNRCPGFRFVAEVKDSTKKVRLVPFVFSTTQAYVLEMGDQYMRAYQSGGQIVLPSQGIVSISNGNPAVLNYSGADTYANGDEVHIEGVSGGAGRIVNGRNFKVASVNTVSNTFSLQYLDGTNVDLTFWGSGTGGTVAEVYQITTPYTEAQLPDLDYSQSADTMFLTHPSVTVRKLVRGGHTAWKLFEFPFLVEPHDEGTRPNTGLTLGATSGSGVSCTAGAACFELTDFLRYIETQEGRAQIASYISQTQVTINIVNEFASTSVSAGSWKLLDSPTIGVTPSGTGPEGASITLTADAATWKNSAQVSDIKNYVLLNDGIVEITGFTSATVVTGTVRRVLTSAAKANYPAWTLEPRIWNTTNGFPRAVAMDQQRLVFGGSNAYPNYVWGSRTALYDDFAEGVADDDAFEFQLVSSKLNAIQRIGSLRALIPLTYGSQFSLRGGIEKPLTPTNVQSAEESAIGAANVKPVRVGNELLYVQRGGRKLRAIGYRADIEAFDAPDITIISEHITESGVIDLAYAQEPDSLVHAVRTDGVMPSLTLEREQEVVGWGRRVTDGVIESVAVIPFGDLDQVWIAVKRTVMGVTRRYIEYAEYKREPDDNAQTDSHLTGSLSSFTISAISWAGGVVTVTTSSPHGLSVGSDFRVLGVDLADYNGNWVAASTPSGTQVTYALASNPGVAKTLGTLYQLSKNWDGFHHLEGRSLDVLGDGLVYQQLTVFAGRIVLPEPVFSVEAGLHYDSEIELLNPAIQTVQGTSQGLQVSVNEVTVRLYRSLGCKIVAGGQTDVIPFRQFGEAVLDAPLEPFTGDKTASVLGWNKASRIRLIQDKPLPFQVLAVMRKVTVND